MSNVSKKMLMGAAGAAGGGAVTVDQVFSTYLYTGNGASRNIVTDLDMTEGGLVWIKKRNGSSQHVLVDSARGVGKVLRINLADEEVNNAGSAKTVTAFNNNGFSLGDDDGNMGVNNQPEDTQVAWSWRKAEKFFLPATVSHSNGSSTTVDLSSLGAVGWLTVKRTDSAGDWYSWHRSLTSGNNIKANTIAKETTTNAYLSVSGTTLTIASGTPTGSYVVYAWADNSSEDAENQMIKCGSINLAAAGGPHLINLGWEPQYVWIKRNGPSGGNWMYADTMRGLVADSTSTTNITNHWDTAAADDGVANAFGLRQNGFVVDSGQITITDANNYIFMAVRAPMMQKLRMRLRFLI